MRMLLRIVLLILLIWPAMPAAAWNALPLSTESPYTLPAGNMQFNLGCGFWGHKNFGFSPFSQHFHRDVYSWPALAVGIGLGSRVDLRFTYDVLFVEEDELRIKERWKSGDLAFFTKIQVLEERRWRPALGVSLGAKLPNAGQNYRVGTDETDLAFLVLAEKQARTITLNAQAGLLILGNPYSMARQDDLLAYGLAATLPVRGPMHAGVELIGQALGTAHNEYASALAHLHLTQERLLWTLSGRVGLLPNSAAWGLSGNVKINLTFEPLRQFLK